MRIRPSAIHQPRRGPSFTALVPLLIALAACGEGEALDVGAPVDLGIDGGVDGSPDAEPDAAEPADLGFPDSGVPGDAGPPPDVGLRFSEASCVACDPNGDCPGTGLCLRAGRETFCADPCGDDPNGCVDGFACVDIGQGQRFCVPPGGTCRPLDTGFGARCYGNTDSCLSNANFCEGDGVAPGYCTRFCQDDCPTGYECRPGDDNVEVCHASYLAPADRCARGLDPSQVPCAIDDDCAINPGSLCLRSEPFLPGVCALPCPTGSCDTGACLSSARGPVCLAEECRCHGSTANGEDLLERALASVGLSRCGLIFPAYAYTNLPRDLMFDAYRLSWYDRTHGEPLRAIDFGQGLIAELEVIQAGPAARAARLIEALAERLERPPVHRAPDPPDPISPLTVAMVELIREAGGTPDQTAIAADAADVPLDLQLALAQILDSLRRTAIARRTAVPNLQNANSLYDYGAAFVAPRADGFGLNVTSASLITLINTNFGYGQLYGAAADVLDAVEAADLGRFVLVPTSSVASATVGLVFNQVTPLGRVVLDDGEAGLYDPGAPGLSGEFLLVVDRGGNDVYRIPVGGNQSRANLASVAIDLGGDDLYTYPERPGPLDGPRLPSDDGGRYTPQNTPDMDNGPFSTSERPRQGGGRLGLGLLLDFGGGRDQYRSLRMSQGSGIFGVGVLLDDGGDDTYHLEAMGQGAGAFGIGLLLDLGGDDRHVAYTEAQGFGYARGAGLAFDLAGDDRWELDVGDPMLGGDPLYFNGQRPGRANTSLGQGFGFGRRADTTDRAFMSGGLGLLYEGGGADVYRASVFAQAGGFWFGTGILADRAGDDRYDGLWYTTAAGAHYALGLLFESGGNDVYGADLPRINVTLAGAHDYTVAALLDESGDDEYRGSRITLGAGNVNGIGLFVDNDGDDTYRPNSAYSLGSAGLLESAEIGSPRRQVPSIGVFLDAAGTDTYSLQSGTVLEGRTDDAAWTSTNNPDPEVAVSERGAGLDGLGDSTLHVR